MRPPKITSINEKAINIIFIIIVAFAIANMLTRTMLTGFKNTQDAYYMGYYGEQILTTGHIPTTIKTSYGELPTNIQNLFPSIAYALAFRLGNLLNIDAIPTKIEHAISIMAACITCILIGRKNKQQTSLILCAITIMLTQYSIDQIRPHVLFTTCLIIVAETYYLILNKKEYHKGWITAAAIATIIATNSQHFIAITIPMTLCGIFVFTPKIPIKEKAKTLPFIGIILLLTLFATPPESGSILKGIKYATNSSDKIFIPELNTMLLNPYLTITTTTLILNQIILTLTTKEKSHLPFVIMAIIIYLSTLLQVRNQYLECAIISLALLTIKTSKKMTISKLITIIISITLSLIIITNGVQKIINSSITNENYTENQGNLEILNYPQNVPNLENKKILCDETIGSWFNKKGALPILFGQTEIYKNIDGTGKEYANQLAILHGQKRTNNYKLEKTPKITDIVYDYCVVDEKTQLNDILTLSKDWQISSLKIPTKHVFENVTHQTLEEQGLCE